MTTLDLRGADIAIRGTVGTDVEVSITFTDSAGDAVDVSGYTAVADVLRRGVSVETFTDAVSGAGNNILTLSLTDTKTTTIGTERQLTWRLSMTSGGDTEHWIAGTFELFQAGHPKSGSGSSSATVTVSGSVTATASVPLPLATLDGRYAPITANPKKASADLGATFFGFPGAAFIGQTTWAVPTLGRLNGIPFVVNDPITVEAVSIYVSTADGTAGEKVRIGILSLPADWTSDNPIVGTTVADFGALAVDSTGLKTGTLGTAVDLDPGAYMAVIIGEISPSTQATLAAVTIAGNVPSTTINVTTGFRNYSTYQVASDQSADVTAGLDATYSMLPNPNSVLASASGTGPTLTPMLFTFHSTP